MNHLKAKCYDTILARYRPNTSDERVLKEVVEKRCYRRAKINFDVEQGEHWLDLGANIGAFAIYCKTRKATAECYEPDPECYAILTRNAAGFTCLNTAVTDQKDAKLRFWKSRSESDYSRGTALASSTLPQHPLLMLNNIYGGTLVERSFDGVKMDIEGSEGGLLDNALLPRCEKLCLEYHLSRDPSVAALVRRIAWLRSRFEVVAYPAELDRIMASGLVAVKTYFDRLIFCMGAK